MSSTPSCGWDVPVCIASNLFRSAAGSAASATIPTAWDEICQEFGRSASWLLATFMADFARIQDVNLASAGIADTYGICLVIGGVVATLLVFGQVIRTMWTHDGRAMAEALTGVAKAVLAWLVTAAVATAAIAAADSMTAFIVSASHDAQHSLVLKLGDLLSAVQVPVGPTTNGSPAQAVVGGSVLLVFALIAIVLVVILWFELLLRNAALAVLIAVSPITAAGQVSEATRAWWTRTASAAVQLIILKPVVALVFAVGFGLVGGSAGIPALLEGLLVLGLAAFSWPVIARFFTFTTIQASSSGLAIALGFVAGRRSGGGGQVAGVQPGMLSQSAESGVMNAQGAGGTTGGAGAGTVAGGIGLVLRTAHGVGSALAGRMEQTASYGGLPGAYPYSTINGRGPAVPPSPNAGPGQGMPRAAAGTTPPDREATDGT